jgi:uncharacterized PurR-regulated membrane protein YhhQ (DUF165 family)
MKQLNEHYKQLDKQYASSIKPLKPKTFKAYPFIIAIMAVLQLSGILYSRYWVHVVTFDLPLGTLICTPIILYIFQIVAECYGWQYARQIVWCNFIVNGLFTLITFFAQKIPISSFTHINLQQAYVNLINTVWITSLMSMIGIFIADYFATVFMSNSRIYFKGNFLVVRLIIVQIVTETILVSTGFIIMPYNGYSMAEAFQSIWQLFIARNIVGLCLSPIAILGIWFIQNRIEKVVSFDSKKNWNIFKCNIEDKDSVQFDSEQWRKLSAQEKLKLDIPAMTVEYYANLDANNIASGALKDKDSYGAKIASMLEGNYKSAAKAKQMQDSIYNKSETEPFFHEGYNDNKKSEDKQDK